MSTPTYDKTKSYLTPAGRECNILGFNNMGVTVEDNEGNKLYFEHGELKEK